MTANIVGDLLLLVAIALGVVAARGVRADARNLGNVLPICAALAIGWGGLTLTSRASTGAVSLLAVVLSPLFIAVLVGFLLWNGVTMLRKEGRSLGNLLSLLAGVALLAVCAAAIMTLLVLPKALPVTLLFVLAGGWVGLLLCAFLGYSWLYQRRIASRRPDFIVTLGSGLIGDRVPPLLAGRIDRALDLYRSEVAAGRHPVLVMSGGKGSDEKCSEAEAMGRYAVEHGIPASDLVLETRSATTEQNLRNTLAMVRSDDRLGEGAKGLAVTSDYHAMRAATLARRLDVPVDVVGARTARYFWPSAVLREFVAVLRDSLKLQVLVAVLVVLPLPVMFAVAIWR